jgi:hypothetical protein
MDRAQEACQQQRTADRRGDRCGLQPMEKRIDDYVGIVTSRRAINREGSS